MNWRSIQEILDYEFCPKYWQTMREHRFYNPPVTLLLERFDRRLETFNKIQSTKKRSTKNNKKRKRKRKKESMVPALVIGAAFMVYLFYYHLFYFFLLLITILLITFFYYRLTKRRNTVSPITKKIYPAFKEELKNNPSLVLLDPPSSPHSKKTYVFGEIPNIKWKKGKFIITIDRSNSKLPKYAPYASYRDWIELVFYMYLIHTNFLTTNISGFIQYQNDTKRIEWPNKTNSKKNKLYKYIIDKSLSKIKDINNKNIKNYSPQQNINPHFGRCAQCPLQNQGCQYARRYPKFYIPKDSNENVENTYLQFREIHSSQLKKTTWHHWKDQIRSFIHLMHSSPIIKKYLKNQVSKSKIFDIDTMIDTAIFNKKELHNGNFQSNIERRSFCYQLLLYLAEVNKNRIKPLMPAYGLTKKYDYKTNDDVKINHFINKNILQSKLVLEIGVMLEEYLEKNKPKQNKAVYNYFRQILNIDHNMGNIIQPTIKTNVTLDDNLDNDSDD